MIHNNTDKNKKAKLKNKYFGSVLLLFYITLLLSGCENKQEVVPVLMKPVKVKLDTETAKIDTIYNIDVFDAAITPYTEGISSEQEFVVKSSQVGIGDKVKKGQVLITMDRSELTKAHEAAKSEIDYIIKENAYTNQLTKCDLEIAQLELAQLKEHGQNKDIKLKEFDIEELKSQYNYAMGLQQLELNIKYKQLSDLEEKLSYPDILAPYDGTITYIASLKIGDTLKPYDPVVYISDDSQLFFQTEFIQPSSIKKADRIYAFINGKEYDLINVPYTTDEFKYRLMHPDIPGNIRFVSRFIPKDTTVSLKSSDYACICIISNYMENVLTIPEKAIYRQGKVNYVYKLVDGERVRQEVEVEPSNNLMVHIKAGLREGDEVYVRN